MTKLKSSTQRAIKRNVADEFPLLEPIVDDLLPKGDTQEAKGKGRVSFVVVRKTPIVFRQQHGPLFPTLRVLHAYPTMMQRVQVDKGAIKFILKGADVMCPGLTSAGGWLPEEDLPEHTAVAVYAEGKEHALAVGQLAMSVSEIRSATKGIGIRIIHYLNDGLWRIGDEFEL
ncbi:mcts1 [Symbiodinium sp. KB8]|nr:mcts1 [Symbiodinium sp. KB8]